MTSVAVPSATAGANISFSTITRLLKNANSMSGLYNCVPGVPTSGQISFSSFANKSQTNQRKYNNCFCHRNDLDYTAPSKYSIYFGRDAGDGNTLKDQVLNGTVDRMYLEGYTPHFKITFDINGYAWNSGLWMFFSSPVDTSLQTTQMFHNNVNFTANVYAYKADTSREISYTRA